MDRHFHEELASLKDDMILMAGLAEKMIESSIRALLERNALLLEGIDAMEARVNRMQCEIDDRCTKLIALHQPTASDLRFILGCMKTIIDIERLADEAVNVSHKAARLVQLAPLSGFSLISDMAKIASGMVRDGIQVYISGNALTARELIRRDEQLNALKRQATAGILPLIQADPSLLNTGLDMILAVRNIERIGDHVKNIAENAIFMAEGCDVRHRAE